MKPRNITELVIALDKAGAEYKALGILPQQEPEITDQSNLKIAFLGVLLGIAFLLGILPILIINITPEPASISPVAQPTPTPTPTPAWKQPTNQGQSSEPGGLILKGEASYYSVEGCLGCSPTLTMANGERLDDTVQTLALTPETVRAHKLLNKYVTVTNIATGDTTTAKVTDTGGFGRYNRVADLNLATKEAINCPGLCQVKIALDK